MALTVAIQMDPIGSIDIIGDTSFALGLEAQERGHHLWYYTPDSLSLNAGRVEATGQSLKLRDVAGDHFDVGNREVRALSDFDVILMRVPKRPNDVQVTADQCRRHQIRKQGNKQFLRRVSYCCWIVYHHGRGWQHF